MDTEILKIPAVALRGMVILPGMIAHFDISRDRSIRAIEQCMMDSQKIFLSAQKDVEQEEPGADDVYHIGVIAEVQQVIKLQNNIVRILVEGIERAELRLLHRRIRIFWQRWRRACCRRRGFRKRPKLRWCAVYRRHTAGIRR